jgi:hypothetical protein
VPYSREALRQDLLRVRNAWDECQGSRERDAIYCYLTAGFDLVTWWTAEHCAVERAHQALQTDAASKRIATSGTILGSGAFYPNTGRG